MSTAGPSDLLLPPRARLLHIGPPKTGTTALQAAAAARRTELLDAGVRYPGQDYNHLLAVSGLMGHGWGWANRGGFQPSVRYWHRLMKEIEADPERRIWLSHEFIAESDDAMAARFASELGPRLHVVITLRSVAAILASTWQQFLKAGHTLNLDRWLTNVIGDKPDPGTTPNFQKRADQGAVVRRWAGTVGPENVTVVILDRNRPELLVDTFNRLLGLPDGLLSLAESRLRNRSMTAVEAEVVRRANETLRRSPVGWQDYERVLRNGAVARILAERRPQPDEPPISLPSWAATRAGELADRYVAQIRESGARVVGDLDTLREPGPVRPSEAAPVCEVPLDLATELLVGAVAGGSGLRWSMRATDDPDVAERELAFLQAARVTGGVSARTLAKVLGWRVLRRADVLTGGRRSRLK